MMRATMDLIAAYNYDSSILDGLVYPEDIDGDVLKDNLLMESAEQELIYSNLDFLKSAITNWSAKQLPIWNELYATTQYEYNPIWNKDGTRKETRDLKATEDVTTNVDRVDDLEDKNTRNFEDKETRDLDDDTTNSVYGFNASTDAPADKSVSNYNGTDTFNHTGTDTFNHTGRQDVDTKVDRDTTDTGTVTITEQGNIGLTSTQDLIKAQRDVVQFNIMDIIIHDFIDRFCLKVY